MGKRIIVLDDGETWETVGGADVWTITDEAYGRLLLGEVSPKDIEADSILNIVEVK